MYTISIDSKDEYKLKEAELKEMDIHSISTNKYHFVHHGKSIYAEVVAHNKKDITIKYNHQLFHVRIKDHWDNLVDSMGFETNEKATVNELMSPMPGLVFDVMVKEGQEVKEGDSLLILEAMKMENLIKSPRDGIISTIHIEKGEPIEKKQILITFS